MLKDAKLIHKTVNLHSNKQTKMIPLTLSKNNILNYKFVKVVKAYMMQNRKQ